MAFGRETNFGFYFVFGICTFFIWCDLGFFSELSEDTKVLGNSTISDHPPATIKLRMQDHFAHYLYLPFCNWLESVFKVSEIPGVTPNLITLMHFILAIIAGRLAAEPGLSWRRLGVIIFEIRSVLDILDGVVFRAQSHNPKFLSGHGTLGWYLDSGADIFGSLFFAVGVMVLYNRYPPVKSKSRLRDTKFKDEESAVKLLSDGSADEDDGSITKRSRFSRRAINITILLYAFQVFIRSALWDHFLQAYNTTLQQKITGVSPALQAKILKYHSTCLMIWSWKIFSADAFMHYSMIATFFNKLWPWMRFWVFFGLPILAVQCLIIQLHVIQVHSWIGV